MRIHWKGEIDNDFYVLGHPAVPLYLLDGANPAIFDAGFTALSRVYEQEINRVLESRSPEFLFLTHAHWDHIGSASYLKSLWPRMKIVASSGTKRIISRPGAIQKIRDFNKEAKDVLRSWGVTEIHEGEFEPFDIDVIINRGQGTRIDSNLTVKPIKTPGHTWDFTTYWVPEKRILIASEAAGCEGICEFLVDYDAYRRSLEKIHRLDARILCTGHNHAFTGEDVDRQLRDAINQVTDYVSNVEELIMEENEDTERVVQRIKAMEWDKKPLPKQPEGAYMESTRIRVMTVLDRMKKSGRI